MPPLLDPPTLVGTRVRLEPLALRHVDDLIVASGNDRSTYAFTLVPDGPDAIRQYVSRILGEVETGAWVPFAQVRVADDRAVGVTNYLSPQWRPDAARPYAVEIGGTWLAHEAQRSGINAEAKLLLLTYAFDVWGVGRVELKTDARNQRSRDAIGAIGAQFEGVLRSAQPSRVRGEEDALRDSAIFSIVATEWPEVRTRLVARIAAREPR
jgi:RimJ/RimL family protein N-acetyltransferase